MNQPKQILTIKQKCRECNGKSFTSDKNIRPYENDEFYSCPKCKGTGQQAMEISALRDFEKCKNPKKYVKDEDCHCFCCGNHVIGYKIPKEYKPYEIKKISEV